jgi:hypothetical protein
MVAEPICPKDAAKFIAGGGMRREAKLRQRPVDLLQVAVHLYGGGEFLVQYRIFEPAAQQGFLADQEGRACFLGGFAVHGSSSLSLFPLDESGLLKVLIISHRILDFSQFVDISTKLLKKLCLSRDSSLLYLVKVRGKATKNESWREGCAFAAMFYERYISLKR